MSRKHPPLPITALFTNATIASNSNLYLPFVGKELAEWLVSLPKPCGVWAAFDQRAKHVLDACRLAGLNVPSQIQVLGVDNETYVCEQTIPSLSSLMPDFENGGFLADVHGTTRRVAAAREFIRQHATSDIGV